ncbi:MAG: DUF2442 domain-containing protein [Candidatus Margulisbacteria bacterium]|jgi:hypothetical protein|nr:DUF2442 domain-containing protein [Candidatus Margulisiibacteriota bacterium]
MYIVKDIAYAGEPGKSSAVIDITAVKPLNNYRLLLSFSTGEKKEYNVKPLLKYPAFQPLKDKAVFDKVRLKYGVPVWNNGEIDIDPECLYENSKDI